MFNIDEALRNHLAQRQKEPKARFVAATVATLSPRSKPGRTRVVAAVDLTRVIEPRPFLGSTPIHEGLPPIAMGFDGSKMAVAKQIFQGLRSGIA